MNTLELSIIIVNYNTREMVLDCLESVYAETQDLTFEVLVVDNASHDGSAEAIAEAYPQVRLFALDENTGFAGGNNLAAQKAEGEYVVLLNPDTIVLDGALQKLHAFAKSHPEAGIVGGRTLNADHSLNPTSCWRRATPWSVFCRAVGLASLFPRTLLFDSESYGRWKRDSVREVDIVTGCLLMAAKTVWDELGGFDLEFFMYGEEADLCARARALGYRPMLTPAAEIIHLVGGTPQVPASRMVHKLRAKRMLFERAWSPFWAAIGRQMLVLWIFRRWLAWRLLQVAGVGRAKERAGTFRDTLARRSEWLGRSGDTDVAVAVE